MADVAQWESNESGLLERPITNLRFSLEQTIVALLEQQDVKQQPVGDQLSQNLLEEQDVKQPSIGDQLSTNDELSLSGTGRMGSNSSEEESEGNQQRTRKGTSSASDPVPETTEGESQESQSGQEAPTRSNVVTPDIELARKVAELGGGLSGCTTVMIKHIPLKYTQRQLMQEINKNGFAERYDFLYMPADARNHGNRGFAFVNFLDAEIALEFYYKHHGAKLQKYNMQKNMVIQPADLQGYKANVEQYIISRTNGKHVPHAEPAFFRESPDQTTSPLKVPVNQKGPSRKNGPKSNGGAHAPNKNTYNEQWPLADPQTVQVPLPPQAPLVPFFCGFCGSPRNGMHAFCIYCGGRYLA